MISTQQRAALKTYSITGIGLSPEPKPAVNRMKLIIEFDAWKDRVEAERAADALTTLGLPTELREVRAMSRQRAAPEGPVKFEAAVKPADRSGLNL